MGASIIKNGHRVLSQFGMGHNREALSAGLIMTYMGMTGNEAVDRICARLRGALSNYDFADSLQACLNLVQRIKS
jgi:hypothetical protein